MPQTTAPRETRLGIDRWSVLGLATIAVMSIALYGVFLFAPTDINQGITQRIFYFHIALAWLAYLSFFVVFVGSVVVLWRGSGVADRLAIASAELGVVFTTLVLISGSLWGRQIWGTWWVWDARLTSTLVLWLIYVGYLMLRQAASESGRASRYAAILGIVGFVDVPIIHLSVNWWRTIHPEPIVANTARGPQLPPSMLLTMAVCLIAFTLLYGWLLRIRFRLECARASVAALRNRLVGAD